MVGFLIFLFIFYISLSTFFIMSSHVLMMLMVLEFTSVTILLMLSSYFHLYLFDAISLIYLLIVMVCEAVMGLVLITLLARTHGSDYFKVSSVFMC
uniref:NADH-ubiquinone oxidoreductase chain 4L n=1 Tax=Acizzia uncatoides TaxID=121830 RepID=A0A344A225_ACIUN|nr:NADH dehydrogenase subunit 4L [Acizzia uncatoides]AWU48816.1 NADH dehydrogenase subunit 4L [Acizzia uncatoides]